MTGAAAYGWDGILDPGERILWQGRPDARVMFKNVNIFMLVFGSFFSAFAFFWMVLASQAGGFLWMFGMLHFSVGLAIAFGPVAWSVWRRRHSWYTLTTQRALIATDIPFRGRRLKSYPISPDTVLDFDNADPATIYFAHETRQGRNTTTRVDIGFERITEGAEVYRLMRDIQGGRAA